MLKLSLIFTLTFGFLEVLGQPKGDSLSSQLRQDTSYYKFRPKFVLWRPHKGYLKTTNLVINMLDVDSDKTINIISPGISTKESAQLTIEFDLKNNAPLLNYDELMKVYKIPSENQSLPVFIDSLLAYKPKQTYYELGDVQSVQVCTEKATGMKYISITTLFPAPKHYDVF